MLKKKVSSKIVALVFGIIVICFAVAVYVSAWTEPGVAPPGDNVPAPLNASSEAQQKIGGLLLNTGGFPNGLIVDQGNVGIGTPDPSAKLEISGVAGVDGIMFPDGTLQTTASSTKGWVVFDGDTAPYNIIRDSANVSSVEYLSGWTYRVNWATSLGDANYAVFITTSAGPVRIYDVTATYVRFGVFSIGSNPQAAPADYISVVAIDN